MRHARFIDVTAPFSLSVLVVSLVLPVFANEGGTSTATFLKIGQGARAEGMGGAFTAVANDSHAVYWNPAGLAQITERQVGFDHLEFIEDIKIEHAALVFPFNSSNGSLGVSGTFADFGTIDRRSETGASQGGDNDVTAYSGTIAWGQAFGDRLALGVGAKYLNQDLAGSSGSGWAADFGGIFYLVPERWAIGVSVLNVGPQIKTGRTKEDLPLSYTVGAAYWVVKEKWVFDVDVDKERDTSGRLKLGTEYIYRNQFVFRGGYQDTNEADGGLSVGLGFLWRPQADSTQDFFGQHTQEADGTGMTVRFDYAYVDFGDFDSTHRFGVQVGF